MAACNHDLDIFTCTLETCCRAQGYVHYAPALGPTVAYLAIFAAFGILQLGLGVWGRTYGFAIGMVCGLLLEVIGYAGRLVIRGNPFDLSIFLL